MDAEIELQPKIRRGLDAFFLSLTLLVCLIATLPQIRVGDYKPHIGFAMEMAENNPVPVPHALFQKLILVLRTLLPFRVLQDLSGFWQYLYDHSFTACAILVAMAAYLATVIILKKRFYQNWKDSLGGRAYFYAWLVAFSLLLVNPIILFTLKSRLILGYIPANLWHNPTYILMRPFALWLFFYIEDHWEKRLDAKNWFLVAFISYLVIFAKPNFTLSMLPALGIFYVLRGGAIRKWNWGLLTALVLPALLSLAYQYWFISQYPTESSFFFEPLIGALYYTKNAFALIVFLLLSIVFPLLILLLDGKQAFRRVDVQLAWLNFGVALLTFLLFTELPHIAMLNFSWGAVMAVFLLFVISLNQLVRDYHRLVIQSWKTNLLLGILALHLVSGVIYTILTIINPGPVR
jgi:hypothetical protein